MDNLTPRELSAKELKAFDNIKKKLMKESEEDIDDFIDFMIYGTEEEKELFINEALNIK